MPALTVTAVRAHSVSDDGLQTSITFTTKYVGDLDVTMPSACIDDFVSALNRAKSAIELRDPKNANELKVTVPKTWLVTSDAQARGVVVLVFNHQTETRAGYALNPNAAKKMAASLVQNADAILSQKVGNSSEVTDA